MLKKIPRRRKAYQLVPKRPVVDADLLREIACSSWDLRNVVKKGVSEML